jgi:hypothetical protein
MLPFWRSSTQKLFFDFVPLTRMHYRLCTDHEYLNFLNRPSGAAKTTRHMTEFRRPFHILAAFAEIRAWIICGYEDVC